MSESTKRADGRSDNELRPLSVELGVQRWAEGSAVISVAMARLCSGRRRVSPVKSSRTCSQRDFPTSIRMRLARIFRLAGAPR